MEIHINDENQLPSLVAQLMQTISCSESFATVVCLEGDLGVGKTTLSKAWAKYLGVTETVTSPTFVILKEYQTTDHRYTKLIHIDAYRLASSKDLEYLGWNDLIANPHNLILLEWPGMVEGLAMPHVYTLGIEIQKDHSRTFVLR